MLKRIVLFLCFPLLFLISDDLSSKHSIGPVPAWVKQCDYPMNPPVKPKQLHIQQLLYDRQSNWEDDTVFFHRVFKVLDEVGVDAFSGLELPFNPSFETLVIHDLRVYRDGKWFDRLKSSGHRIDQKENHLQHNTFPGGHKIVYFLDDVREGDLVEYAISFIGSDPALSPRHEEFLVLQLKEEVCEKFHHRIVSHRDKPIFIKKFNTTQHPVIKDLDSALREWIWEAVETAPYSAEEWEPSWHDSKKRIQVSQFRTWKEAANHALQFYTLQGDFALTADPEMLALVKTWQAAAKDKKGQALQAIRFVQDKVRYLCFNGGMNGIQPVSPNITFKCRYGDCKNKTMLLYALLQLMDIPSYPVLVNRDKSMAEYHPSLACFDHVVLELYIDDSTYWVETTSKAQGGELAENYFPNYRWGLVLAKETKDLIPLPKPILKKPIEIDSSFIFTGGDTAELKTVIKYYGFDADSKRWELKWKGYQKFADGYLEMVKKDHKEVAVAAPLVASDDREKNVFSVSNSYRIKTDLDADNSSIPLNSYIIKKYLDQDAKVGRKAPYALSCPVWVKEHIHIENPFSELALESKDQGFEHEFFRYKHRVKKEGSSADVDLELAYLTDHIPAEAVDGYVNIVSKIEKDDQLTLGKQTL